MGQPLGTRPAGMAHRMLRDERDAFGRNLRYPWRRSRSCLPASRERDCAEHLRARWPPIRAVLDAQRDADRRRRQDVEVARQYPHRARVARRGAGRGDPPRAADGALSRPARLDEREAAPGAADARSLLPCADPAARRRLRAFWRGRRGAAAGARRARRRSQHSACADASPRARRGDQSDELRRRAVCAAAGARSRRPVDGAARPAAARLAARQRESRCGTDRAEDRRADGGAPPAPLRRGRPYPHRARRRGYPARRPAGRHDDLVAEGLSMAGTDHRGQAVTDGPAIILVEPQLGENIGTAARAMLNCGLGDLRLVRPRDGWPSDKAVAAASGADRVLNAARLYPSVEAAIGDLAHVYAATARDRYMVKRELTPRRAAEEMRGFLAAGEACGVLFGPERTGLVNDQVALADTVVTVPLNPAFSSLNLAQAVLIVGYEWFTAKTEPKPETLHTGHSRPANKAELLRFFEHFEEALCQSGFLRHPDKRPSMTRNLRNLFQRAGCTEQALRTLHGSTTALVGPRKRGDGGPPLI